MASLRSTGGEGATGEEGAAVLGAAFQQVAQGLERVQEALRLQEQRAATALRETVQRLQRERDDALRALRETLREQLEGRIKSVEERMAVVEARLGPSAGREGGQVAGGHKSVEQLESRVEKLEAAVQRALGQVFPRVEALVEQLEKPSSPGAAPAPSSSPASTSTTTRASPSSAVPPADSSSASDTSTTPSTSTPARTRSPAASALGATGRAATDADEEDRERQQVLRRIDEVESRRDIARAFPSSRGEDLCRAAHQGRLNDIRRLLNSGADVNYTNSYGNCPLMCALEARVRKPEVVSLLLEKGANVNAVQTTGWTAFHFAARDGLNQIIALLIRAGGDVNARDMDGRTPLHLAAHNKHEAAVLALLAAGARKEARCWGEEWVDKRPLDVTKSDNVLALLRQ